MTREPVLIIAAIVALIELIIPVLLIFEVLGWTDAQVGAVMALVIGAGTVLGGLFARSKVTSVATLVDAGPTTDAQDTSNSESLAQRRNRERNQNP